jgi:hypothetical protein
LHFCPSNIITVEITGINPLENEKFIRIYPNPFGNELIIEMTENKQNVHFEIVNLLGQVVYQGEILEKTIVNTTGFVSGLYEVKIGDAKQMEVRKVVK